MTAQPGLAPTAAPTRVAEGVLARLAAGAAGPTRLAVALAMLSAPFVGLSFLLPPLFEVDEGFQPPNVLHALVIAAIATVGAALAGGTIGGLFVRSRPTLGALLALAVAWPAGVSLVSIAATALDLPFETAYSCFDTCGPAIHGDDALSGLGTYAVAVVVSTLTLVPIAIALLCLFGAWKLNQGGAPFVATVVLAIGYGSLHWLAFLAGSQPIVSYVALMLGVALWTRVLRAPSSTLTPQ